MVDVSEPDRPRCRLCGHDPHEADDCAEVVGYDHLNGDHDCGCPGFLPELADFGPDGHLLTESPSDCTGECAGYLYALAQDAESAVSRVETLCDEWETLQKGPGPTTDRIRAALRPAT